MERFENPIRKFIRETDKVTLFTSIIASAFGILLVHSATYRLLKPGEWIGKSTIMMLAVAVVGIVIGILVSNVDYEIFAKLWPLVAVVCVGLMIVVKLFGEGTSDRPDSAVWLKFGSFSLQPSEFVKIGFIITFSYHLDLVKEKISKFTTVLGLGVHAVIPVGLVMWTGDDGSALVFILIFVGMMFMANVNILYFLAGIAAVCAAVPILWSVPGLITQFQKDRVLAIIYPDLYEKTTAFQQNHVMNAIGSGGLFGKGYLNGTLIQSGTIPESSNDMILSVAGEEFGFAGTMLILILLFVLIFRVYQVGLKARDNIGYLMCCGVAFMFAAQVFINIGMALRLLPVIGITLPFFSAGGSSSLALFLAVGLVLSVYRSGKQPDNMLFYKK